MDQTERDQDQYNPRVSRIVDVKVPLWGLICAFCAAAFFLVSMYFTTGQTAKDVTELQAAVKAFNTQVTSLAGEQALIRFRMENIEGDMRAIKGVLSGTAPANAPTQPLYPNPGTRRVP